MIDLYTVSRGELSYCTVIGGDEGKHYPVEQATSDPPPPIGETHHT